MPELENRTLLPEKSDLAKYEPKISLDSEGSKLFLVSFLNPGVTS